MAEDDRDLSEVPTDELIRLARKITAARRRHEREIETLSERQGQLIAELVKRQGWTYAKIAEAVGVDDSTAHRRARPYL